MATTQALPAYFSLLVRKDGVDGVELQAAMGRKYRLSRWSLRIIGDKYGYVVNDLGKGKNGLMRYIMVPVEKAAPKARAAKLKHEPEVIATATRKAKAKTAPAEIVAPVKTIGAKAKNPPVRRASNS